MAACLASNQIRGAATGTTNPSVLAEQARRATEKGDYESALIAWQNAARDFGLRGQSAEQLQAQIETASTLAALGQSDKAAAVLRAAIARPGISKNSVGLLAAQTALGGIYVQMRAVSLAEPVLNAALESAKRSNNEHALALLWNNIGSLRAITERNSGAVDAYRQSLELARKTSDGALAMRVLLNLAALARTESRFADAGRFLREADDAMRDAKLIAANESAQLQLALATAYLDLWKGDENHKGEWLDNADNLGARVVEMALKAGNDRARSLALGLRGEAHELESHVEFALESTRQARFLAQQTQSPHLLYRWDWQLGRLLKSQGKLDESIAAYRRAISTFRTLCDCDGGGAFDYDETVRPLYYQLADVLLRRSAKDDGAREVQALLSEARDTVELLKTAELSDYFQDGCVAGGLAKTRDIETVLNGAAAVYILPLPDRTEIVLGLPSGLKRFTAPITGTALMARARRLRLQLQRTSSDSYLAYSRELYDLLIKPLEPTLQTNRVETLVFVLDGALRSIPFAALHNGEKFLAEKYSLAVAPGLTLLDPKPIENRSARVWSAGISHAVQGFSALQGVPEEIAAIQDNYEGTALLNGQFIKSKMVDQISNGDYSIVHIASHGEFGARADSTYLLTYDGKITLNELEGLIRPRQFRGKPVELLFLSACETAAGDDRAALGLAGIAIKAGARSALASLWSVNDQATAELVAHFYTELKTDAGISKAAALRKAQTNLMHDKRFSHPAFWAPFLVIGNWL